MKSPNRLSFVSRALGRGRGRLWKLAYLGAASVLFLMGLQRRFALPLVPILDPDSPNYLWPGLLALNGEGFTHNAGLNFMYPGVLFALLRGFGDFRSIVVVQHVLGVAAGLFLLLAWNKIAPSGSAIFRKSVHMAIGLAGVGIYLLSPIPVMFELHIRPEALCMFFQMLSFWLLVEVIFCCGTSGIGVRAVVYGIACATSALLLYSLKPSYALTALLTLGFVSGLIMGRSAGWKFRALYLFGLVTVALLVFVPERLLGRSDRLTKMFLPQTLFSVHANLIRDQIGDDLAQRAPVPFPRLWLQSAYDGLGVELTRSEVRPPGQFSLLGFNPDSLMNGEAAIFNQWLQQLGSDEQFERFLMYYYWRSLSHRPLAFSAKIARQLAVFYAWKCPAFHAERRIFLVSWHYRQSVAVMSDPENWAELRKNPAGLRLRAQSDELLTSEKVFNSGKRLFSIHTLLGLAYLPVLVLGFSVALWMLFKKCHGPNRWRAVLVIFFFLANFGNVMAISAVHSMEVLRYSTIQFSAALFAELWAISYGIDLALSCFEQRRRRSGADPFL